MSQDEARRGEPNKTDGDPADTTVPDGQRAEREADFTRRALLRAGWTAPAILAVAVPQTAFAQSSHTDVPHSDGHSDHSDGPHSDAPHTDGHSDGHGDVPTNGTHNDIPHSDHTDNHTDDAHTDGHTDNHTDITGLDISHSDSSA